MEVDSIIIRKSPIILLYKMVLITLALFLSFTFYSLFLYEELDNASLGQLFAGKAFFLTASFGAEALAMIILFLQWSYATYEIKSSEMILRTGIFWRRQEVHSLRSMQAVYITQGFFGTMLNYGTMTFHNPLSKEEIHLKHIPDPEKYALILRRALEDVSGTDEKIVPKR